MDPLSALSVATNVIQFVDFTSKIVSGSYQLYKSGLGESEQNAELNQVTTKLISLNDSLERSLHTQALGKDLSQIDIQLRDLCNDCNIIAHDLILALKKLQSNRHSKWNSVILALRTIWTQDDIDKLQHRVDGFRQQITMHVLVALRGQIAAIDEQRLQTVSQLDKVLLQTRYNNEAFLHHFEQSARWQRDIVELIHREHSLEAEHADHALQFTKGPLMKDTLNKFAVTIFSQLSFYELDDRHERISQAHERTFRWILHEPDCITWSSFVDWLKGDDPLYWITGKAGAGKSTLMKFVYHAPETEKFLQVWGAGKSIIQATFFFWNSGTSIQMSQEGLLRTLLHQILTQRPHLVSRVFPQRFETFLYFRAPDRIPLQWSELTKAFRKVVEELNGTTKIALFIDGLDEFNGSHRKLIEFTRSLLSPGVKMCVSSRPWIVFEDAFRHEPNIMLQDLTFQDIYDFVSSNLSSNPGFRALEIVEPEYALGLVRNVTAKSSGVFLWVHLVVNSLLEGLSGGERLSDLQRRLDSLPPDLEDLFWKILNQLEPNLYQHGLRLILLVRSVLTPLTLLLLFFADDENAPNLAFGFPIGLLSQAQSTARAEIMRRRLNTCTKGLLEATSSSALAMPDSSESKFHIRNPKVLQEGSLVGYLHRTVKDFMEKDEVWTKLQSSMRDPVDVNVLLCGCRIIQLKTLALESFRGGEYFWNTVRSGIEHAARADPECTSFQFQALNKIDSTATVLFSDHIARQRDYRASQRDSMIPATLYENSVLKCPEPQHWAVMRVEFRYCHSFLYFAVQCHLYTYVKASLHQNSLATIDEGPYPLLFCAMKTYKSLPDYNDPSAQLQTSPSLGLTRLLLQHGANPEARIGEQTIWQTVSEFAYSQNVSERQMCNTIMTQFMKNGARRNNSAVTSRIKDTKKDNRKSILDRLFNKSE